MGSSFSDVRKTRKRNVSLILPAFGSNASVKETLLSIKSQSVPFDEIIVVDDNPSYPDRATYFRETLGANLNITYIKNSINLGSAASLNLGIEVSMGEIIVLCNDDDLFQSSRNISILNNSASLISSQFWGFTSVRCIDKNSTTCDESSIPQDVSQALFDQSQNSSFLVRLKRNNISISSGNLFFSRDIWSRVGKFNTELKHVHDWEMAIKLAILEDPIFLEGEVYSYRLHPENSFRKIEKEITASEVRKAQKNCEDFFWASAKPNQLRDFFPELFYEESISQAANTGFLKLGSHELRLLKFFDAFDNWSRQKRLIRSLLKFLYKRIEVLLIRLTTR